MDVLDTNVKWQFSMVCLDDIVVFLQISDERIQRVGQGLTLLIGTGLTLK